MKHTIWGKVPEHPNYWVSIDGEVFSTERVTGLGVYGTRLEKPKMLSQFNKRKYKYVALGKGLQESVHRLVAMTFLPNRTAMVCHKNDIGTHNNIENLYWGTAYSNTQDALRNGYRPKISKAAHAASCEARRSKVYLYNDQEELLFNSKTEAARYLGIGSSAISNALKNAGTVGRKSNGFKGAYYVREA